MNVLGPLPPEVTLRIYEFKIGIRVMRPNNEKLRKLVCHLLGSEFRLLMQKGE